MQSTLKHNLLCLCSTNISTAKVHFFCHIINSIYVGSNVKELSATSKKELRYRKFEVFFVKTFECCYFVDVVIV